MEWTSHSPENLHSTTAATDQRLEWVTPAIQKMEAGDAEAGIILGPEIIVLLQT